MERNPAPPLQIEISWDGVLATVTVAGELDITTTTDLEMCLRKVAAAHPERLVLDLSGLVFIDVAGARSLDAAYKTLKAECPVILRGLRPSARKVFRLTGLMGD